MRERDFSISAFFFRVLPAVSGALLGSIFALGFFLLLKMSSGVEEGDTAVFSRFVLFSTVFVTTLLGNILAVIFSSMALGEDFSGKFRPTLMHIFFSMVGLFLLIAPLFLALSLESALGFVRFFLPFSAISTTLFFRLFAEHDVPVLAAYEAVFGGFVVIAITALLFPAVIPVEMMPFFALPIAWLLLPSVGFAIEKIFVTVKNITEKKEA